MWNSNKEVNREKDMEKYRNGQTQRKRGTDKETERTDRETVTDRQ